MVIAQFPPLETADEYGLLAIGGDLDVESLLLAYRSGIFPWPVDSRTLAWFTPPERTLLFLDEFRISRSLEKERRKTTLRFGFDAHFPAVIHACAELKNRKMQSGTWIIPQMIEAYIELWKAGYAHSIEAHDGDKLVGGLYGVSIGGMFAGESMFYRQPNASKLCMCHLVSYLKEQGVEWIDCQVMTPFLKSLGAREVERRKFIKMLAIEVEKEVKLFS